MESQSIELKLQDKVIVTAKNIKVVVAHTQNGVSMHVYNNSIPEDPILKYDDNFHFNDYHFQDRKLEKEKNNE